MANSEKLIIAAKPSTPEPTSQINIQDQIDKGVQFLNEIEILENSNKAFVNLTNREKKEKERYDKILTEMNALKKEKIELLSSSSLPKGLSVDEESGKIEYNGLDFTDTEVSESQAKICILELKCNIETAPFIDMGNVGDFDEKSLGLIYQLAEKYKKFMILEKILHSTEDIKYINVVANE